MLSDMPWAYSMSDLYVVHFDAPGGGSLDELRADAREEHDEDLEPDVKTTFAHFGLAYYQASVLEHEIVNIHVAHFLGTRSPDAEQLLSDPRTEQFKATMGALLKQLQPYAQADPELAADLAEALRLRNHLAHGFWRERADDFCTEEGRTRMIAYLIKTRKQFEDVDQRLTATIGTSALRQWGVTPEVVDAWYQDMLGQIERGESNVPPSTIQSARDHLLSRVALAS